MTGQLLLASILAGLFALQAVGVIGAAAIVVLERGLRYMRA